MLHSSHYPPILNFNAYFLRVSLKRIEYIFPPPRVIFSLIIAIDHQMTDLFSYSRRRIYIFHFCFNKRNNKKKKKNLFLPNFRPYTRYTFEREKERERKKRGATFTRSCKIDITRYTFHAEYPIGPAILSLFLAISCRKRSSKRESCKVT